MTVTYAAKLSLKVRHTNDKAQKINGSIFKTFGMVLAIFQIEDKQSQVRYFQETFLLADTYVEMVLRMPFLNFSNTNVSFSEQELI